VTTASTLMSAELLPSLKIKKGDKTHILRLGIFVLGYTAAIAFCGLLFLLMVSAPQNFGVLLAEMPGDGGAAQIKAYASWGVGACLTVAATLLGVPPPKSPET
jgi:hypothetical protein